MVFFFFFLDLKHLFWVNLVQNLKTLVEVEIWSLIYIEYVKFDGDILYFCLTLFTFSTLMLTD